MNDDFTKMEYFKIIYAFLPKIRQKQFLNILIIPSLGLDYN